MNNTLSHQMITQVLLRWHVGGFGSGIDPALHDRDERDVVARNLYLFLDNHPRVRDAMVSADLIVVDSMTFRGKYANITRLTPRGQRLAATLVSRAVEYVECDMEPECGDTVLISTKSETCPGAEGVVDGIDASSLIVVVDGEPYEIQKDDVTLVSRAESR